MPLQPFKNQNYDLKNPQNSSKFQADVANFLNGLLSQIQNPQWLAQILNSQAALGISSLQVVTQALGTVSTNQSVNCANAAMVAITFGFSASITLSLTNLAGGVPVAIAVGSTGAFTLKVTATQPNGSAYTNVVFFQGGTQTNFSTTGWASSTASRIFLGISNPGSLQFAFV